MGGITPETFMLDRQTAHGIKNQLSVILGFCDLLKRSLDEHDARLHDVQRIETAAGAALALLRDQLRPMFGEQS